MALPVILFLASLTLWLETTGLFRAADDMVISAVASTRSPANVEEPHERVASVIVSNDLFVTKLGRTLPFDKSRLADYLMMVAHEKPAVIAVDVDAIPRDVEPGPQADATRQPMFRAIRRVLEANIPIVLVSYPSKTQEEEARAYAWRRKFCEAAATLRTDAGKPAGKLWWASTYLQTEGHSRSVLRYHAPSAADKLAKSDEYLLPLGLVLSVASDLADGFKKDLLPWADYCQLVPDLPSPAGGKGEVQRRVNEPGNYVNYFGKMPVQIWLTAATTTLEGESSIRGAAVVLGVQSFEGVDEHQTPLARMPGATVHALIAASIPVVSHYGHALAFLGDLLLGYFFVIAMHWLQDRRHAIGVAWPDAPSVLRLTSILVPVVPLVLTTAVILEMVPLLASRGAWISPLPMQLGLIVHLYVELVHGAEHGEAHSPGEAMRRWKKRFFSAGSQWLHFFSSTNAIRSDVVVWTLVQLAMACTVINAIVILIRH